MRMVKTPRLLVTMLPALLLMAPPAGADAYFNRYFQALRLQHTLEGQAYQKAVDASVGKTLSQAAKRCAEQTVPADIRTFTVIFNVDDSGTIRDLAFRPSTNVARCFTRALVQLALPAPPADAGGESGYPMQMKFAFQR